MADASIASGNFKNIVVLTMAVMDQLITDVEHFFARIDKGLERSYE